MSTEDVSVDAAAEFLVDCARAGLSTWTVVNVLRHWLADGADATVITDAMKIARRRMPHRLDTLEAYEIGIRKLL